MAVETIDQTKALENISRLSCLLRVMAAIEKEINECGYNVVFDLKPRQPN